MSEYENDIRIDETALDVEWLEQPSLMMKYARTSSHARMILDQKKEALELVKAELDREIRTNPSRFGIEKVTEAVVTAAIISHADYKEASDALISAKFESDIAQGALKAFDARKDALENLVKLHGMQYFAGPKMPRDLSQERERIQRDVNKSIAQKMRKRIV